MKISGDRISVFFSRTGQADVRACRAALSSDEREKAEGFMFEKDRQLSILARAQIRYLISEVTGEPAAHLSFSRDEWGKPRIRPGTPGDGISFSISHTRGMVMSALGLDSDLGADMEALDRKVDPAIARRFFSPAEADWLMTMPSPERGALFLRLWTLKEAWAKAEGRGIAAGLDRMVFDLSRADRIRWQGPEEKPLAWQFFQFFPAPAAVAALGVKGARPLTVDVYHCIPFRSVEPLDLKIIPSDPRPQPGPV